MPEQAGCCLTVLKSGTKVSAGPARLRPQAGALPGLGAGSAGPAPSACVGVHTRWSLPLPSPLCVCVHLLSAYGDTRHSGIGSTLMTFSLTWLHLRRPFPDEALSQMVRTSALWRKRPFFLSQELVTLCGQRARRQRGLRVLPLALWPGSGHCPSLPLARTPSRARGEGLPFTSFPPAASL